MTCAYCLAPRPPCHADGPLRGDPCWPAYRAAFAKAWDAAMERSARGELPAATLPGNGARGPFLLTFTSSGGSIGAGKP